MSIQTCSICSKTVLEVKSWSHCPKEKALVCLTHCYNECSYMDRDMGHCMYRYLSKQRRA